MRYLHEIRHKLTPAEWDMVYREIRGGEADEMTYSSLIEVQERFNQLLGLPWRESTIQTAIMLLLNWKANAVAQGYRFTHEFRDRDSMYWEFFNGPNMYCLRFEARDLHTEIRLRKVENTALALATP